MRREIPGVTQIDEMGHEGNTAIAKALIVLLDEIWSTKQHDSKVEYLCTTVQQYSYVQQYNRKKLKLKQNGAFELTYRRKKCKKCNKKQTKKQNRAG